MTHWRDRKTPEELREIDSRISESVRQTMVGWSLERYVEVNERKSEAMLELHRTTDAYEGVTQRVWDSYTPGDKQARLGKSILSPEVQERAYRRGIGRLTLEERQEAARKGFMSPESVRKRTETMRSRLEEEKERRSQASSRVQRGRWDSMSEGERKTIAARISWGLKKYYEGLSGKERDMISRERSEHMQKFWASLPEDERAVFGWNGDESRLRNRQSCERGPTEPELFLGMYLEKYFPGKWAYNGDGNQNVVVGRRTPDFVRLDGKKQVIEVLGGLGWWHFEEEVEGKIERYKKYGYDCIVVLGYDCYLKEELDKAILEGSTDPIEIRDVTELRSSEVTVGLAGLREKGLVAEEEAEPIEL